MHSRVTTSINDGIAALAVSSFLFVQLARSGRDRACELSGFVDACQRLTNAKQTRTNMQIYMRVGTRIPAVFVQSQPRFKLMNRSSQIVDAG